MEFFALPGTIAAINRDERNESSLKCIMEVGSRRVVHANPMGRTSQGQHLLGPDLGLPLVLCPLL
jgi:hypothetical protein